MTDQGRGMLAVVAAALCVSTVPAAIKFGLSGSAQPFQLLAPRMILGVALIWIWVGLTRPDRIRIDASGLAYCALAGLANAFALSFFYLALTRLDASITNIVFAAYPAMLLTLWLLVGEEVTRLDWIRLVCALSGIWLIAGPGGELDPLGLLFALLSPAAYALYVRVVHARLGGYAISTQVLWTITFLGIAVQVPAAYIGSIDSLDARGWGVVLWTAIFGTAIARTLNLTGIRLIGGGQTALLQPVETVLTVGWASLLLGERLSTSQLGGGALVVVSIGLAALRGRWRILAGTPKVAASPSPAGDTGDEGPTTHSREPGARP